MTDGDVDGGVHHVRAAAAAGVAAVLRFYRTVSTAAVGASQSDAALVDNAGANGGIGAAAGAGGVGGGGGGSIPPMQRRAGGAAGGASGAAGVPGADGVAYDADLVQRAPGSFDYFIVGNSMSSFLSAPGDFCPTAANVADLARAVYDVGCVEAGDADAADEEWALYGDDEHYDDFDDDDEYGYDDDAAVGEDGYGFAWGGAYRPTAAGAARSNGRHLDSVLHYNDRPASWHQSPSPGIEATTAAMRRTGVGFETDANSSSDSVREESSDSVA
jgi:hypothetical protein